MLLYQLTRPLAYLAIQHPQKWQFDWLLPGASAILTGAAIAALPQQPVFFGKDGLLQSLIGVVQNLPGFYIAALAAIVAFDRDDMDEIMPPPTPTIYIRAGGREREQIGLTRRRFLCILFGYLTFVSLLICFGGLLANFLADPIKQALPELMRPIVKGGFLLGVALCTYSMLTATMWSLYYLGERIHQPNAK